MSDDLRQEQYYFFLWMHPWALSAADVHWLQENSIIAW